MNVVCHEKASWIVQLYSKSSSPDTSHPYAKTIRRLSGHLRLANVMDVSHCHGRVVERQEQVHGCVLGIEEVERVFHSQREKIDSPR